MMVSAAMLASELGVTARTVSEHVRAMERSGEWPGIRARVGRPRMINREIFLRYVYGETWREQVEGEHEITGQTRRAEG